MMDLTNAKAATRDEQLDALFERALELVESSPNTSVAAERLWDEVRSASPQPVIEIGSSRAPAISREDVLRMIEIAAAVAPRAELNSETPSQQIDAWAASLTSHEIVRELGRGGMGVVYLARQASLGGREVALKVLPPGASWSAPAQERFRRESRAISKLRHANIIVVHDVIESHGRCGYSMEYIEGTSLAEVLAHAKAIGLDGLHRIHAQPRDGLAAPLATIGLGADEPYEHSIARIGVRIALALGAVHRAGLLHRDVKPANILLRRDGTPLLSDFGLVHETDATLSVAGSFVGTPMYASPEQLRGQRVDARSDVYALGATLFHSLSLQTPFEGRTAAGVLESMRERRSPPPLRKLNPRVARDLETVIATAIELDPTRRYADADLFADDLERVLADRPVRARPATTWYLVQKCVRRNPTITILGIACVLALVLGLAGTTWQAISATRAGEVARQEREVARAKEYVAIIAAADAATRAKDPLAARAALEKADPAMRGWEWWRLESQLDASEASLTTVWSADRLTLSPNGRYAVVSTIGSPIIDVEARSTIRTTFGRGMAVRSVFSRDSALVAMCAPDSLTVEETVTGRVLHSRAATSNPPFGAWLEGGDGVPGAGEEQDQSAGRAATVLAVAYEGSIQRWTFPDLEPVDQATSLPAGRILAYGSASGSGRLLIADERSSRLVDVHTGEVVATFEGHSMIANAAMFCADGATLATSSADGTVRVWDVATARERRRIDLGGETASSIAIDPSGGSIAACVGRSVRVLDARSGALVGELVGHRRDVKHACFLPSSFGARGEVPGDQGWRLLTCGKDTAVKWWRLEPADAASQSAAKGLRLAAADTHLAANVGASGFATASSATLQMWDANASALLASVRIDNITSLDGSAMMPLIAVGTEDGSVLVLEYPSGREAWRARVAEGRVHAAALAPEGDRVAVVADGTMRVWSRNGDASAWTLADVHWSRRPRFSPKGDLIAMPHLEGVLLINSRAGAEAISTARRLHGQGGEHLSVAFSSDGTRLATGSYDRTARVWDVATGACVAVLSGATAPVVSVSFSSDDRQLIGMDSGDLLHMWDVERRALVYTERTGVDFARQAFMLPGSSGIVVARHPQDAPPGTRFFHVLRSRSPEQRLVSDLMQEHITPARVRAALEARTDLDPEFRARALEDARTRAADPGRLNTEAWGVVCYRGRTAAEYARAEKLAQAAVELAPENGHIHGTYATALYRVGKYEAALAHAERALASHGAFAPDLSVKVMSLSRLGRLHEAEQAMAELEKVKLYGADPGALLTEAREELAAVGLKKRTR